MSDGKRLSISFGLIVAPVTRFLIIFIEGSHVLDIRLYFGMVKGLNIDFLLIVLLKGIDFDILSDFFHFYSSEIIITTVIVFVLTLSTVVLVTVIFKVVVSNSVVRVKGRVCQVVSLPDFLLVFNWNTHFLFFVTRNIHQVCRRVTHLRRGHLDRLNVVEEMICRLLAECWILFDDRLVCAFLTLVGLTLVI